MVVNSGAEYSPYSFLVEVEKRLGRGQEIGVDADRKKEEEKGRGLHGADAKSAAAERLGGVRGGRSRDQSRGNCSLPLPSRSRARETTTDLNAACSRRSTTDPGRRCTDDATADHHRK